MLRQDKNGKIDRSKQGRAEFWWIDDARGEYLIALPLPNSSIEECENHRHSKITCFAKRPMPQNFTSNENQEKKTARI